LNFLDTFSGKKAQISDFITIRPVEAELFHADGHDETNIRFSQFRKRA
jgi:hypothetical protein